MSGDESQPVGQNEIDELLKQAAAAGSPASSENASSTADVGSQALSQDDVDALLAATQGAPTAARPAPAPASPPTGAVASAAYESPIAADDIELLLSHAERALASAQQPASKDLPPGVKPFRFEDFGGAPASTEAATIELIRDVELDLKIELGRTQMYLEDVLKLRKGSVVPLDKLAGDPVDIYVNGRLIARGEVLLLNDNFCVRVAELISGDVAPAG
jgi:flagellar motor switch protein FliN/FliY